MAEYHIVRKYELTTTGKRKLDKQQQSNQAQ
jgi:hypothetical protein